MMLRCHDVMIDHLCLMSVQNGNHVQALCIRCELSDPAAGCAFVFIHYSVTHCMYSMYAAVHSFVLIVHIIMYGMYAAVDSFVLIVHIIMTSYSSHPIFNVASSNNNCSRI